MGFETRRRQPRAALRSNHEAIPMGFETWSG